MDFLVNLVQGILGGTVILVYGLAVLCGIWFILCDALEQLQEWREDRSRR